MAGLGRRRSRRRGPRGRDSQPASQRSPGSGPALPCLALPTFVHAGEAILEHGEFVDLAEFLEEGLEVGLLQVPRDLADEELDGIVVLHGNGGGVPRTVV